MTRALCRRFSGLFSVSLIAGLLALQALGGSALPGPAKPHADDQSLKALRTHIAVLKAKHANEPRGHEEGGPVKEDESTDYLDALEAYMSVRAYPNDRVDWDVLRSASAIRQSSGPIPATGANWQFMGPNNCTPPSQWAFGPTKIAGRVASAAIDPTNSLVMFVAAATGGVWKTADGGTTWTPLGDGWNNIPASCVVLDPANPNVVFVGTGDWDGWGGYSQGIERSTDGGATWTTVGTQFGEFSVRRILIDPDNDSIVTAVTSRGSGGDGEVWRSTDAGLTWNPVITTTALWSDVVCGASDGMGNRTYYAVAGGTSPQLWISINRGASWSAISTPMRSNNSIYDTADLAASPTTLGTVYLLDTGDQKVYKSTNTGGTWTDVTNSALLGADWSQAWYDFYISCSTSGGHDVLYVGLIDLLQSTDGGASWHSFMNGYTGSDLAHVDQHDLIVDPSNSSHVLACNDGGVYSVAVTGNGGAYTSLNGGLGITQFYWGDVHPTNTAVMIGGSQDNGTPAAFGDLTAWASVTAGDGGAALMNQLNPNIQYSSYQYFGGASTGGTIGFNRTPDDWATYSWTTVNVGSDTVAWMGPMVMAATDPTTIYIPTNYLWEYSDTSGVFTPRLGNQLLSTTSTVLSIGVTKADPTVIYTGSGDGQLWLTRNSGSTWTQINAGVISLPNRAYTAISVRDDDANDLLVGLSGTSADHLWRCFDSSSGTRTWIDVSGTGPTALPGVPVNAIARDPADPNGTWYAGTDIGVFKTTNAGNTWQDISQELGLPNVQISQLWVRSDTLFAFTYGRGVWSLDLSGNGGGNSTLSGLTLDPTAVIGPASSTGTVTLSAPAPTGGAIVSLTSSNAAVASVPSTVAVPEGLTTATFTVSTTSVPSQTFATISASLNGTNASADLTINPNGLIAIAVNPSSMVGGTSAQGTVTISVPAPSGGAVVHLTSSNTSVAQVPSTVTIASGHVAAVFTVTTTPTASDTTSTIKATLGTTIVQTQITVTAPVVSSFRLASSTVVGGNTDQATITLSGKAPSAGLSIALSSSLPSVASVPTSVTISSGATTVSFTVTTHTVNQDTSVTLSETLRGVEQTVNLDVIVETISALTITPNPAVGGNTLQGKVTLAGPATSGTVVDLSTTNTGILTIPTSVSVSQGQTSATFSVPTRTVNSTTSATVYATLGSSMAQVQVTLTALQLTGFTLSTYSTYERMTVTGTLTLNGAALSGGAVIQIGNSNPSAATAPTSVAIPQGATSKTFTITAKSVTSPLQTTFTASRNGTAIPQTLSVSPVALESLNLNYASVVGGTSVQGVVRIAIPAPSGGIVVNLSSSYPSVAKPPTSVTIGQGATTATFTMPTYPVGQTYFVVITAQHASSSVTAQLQVLPPEVSAFRLSTSSIQGGRTLTGTIILTGKAPPGGITVTVNANPYLAWPTRAVVVTAGSTSVSFTIATSTVTSSTPVVMTAYTFSVMKSVTLTLTP